MLGWHYKGPGRSTHVVATKLLWSRRQCLDRRLAGWWLRSSPEHMQTQHYKPEYLGWSIDNTIR